MALIDSARRALEQKNFSELDDLWTEMVINEQTALDQLLELAKELKKYDQSERALGLLEMLRSHLESKKSFSKAIEVCKNMIYHCKDDTEVRGALIELYKKAYPRSEALNDYIEVSGLNKKGEAFFKSIDKLNLFLKYDVGNHFYFERYGIGQVVETRPAKREIIIDFENKKHHFLTLDVAEGLLLPVLPGDFLYLKHTDIERLQKMAQDSPLELVKLILKQFAEPLTGTQIKAHLNSIIEPSKINRFWDRVKKMLEKEPDVQVSGRTNKTYTFVSSDLDKTEIDIAEFKKASAKEKYLLAEEFARNKPEILKRIMPELIKTANRLHKKEPWLSLDILLFCNRMKINADFEYTLESLLNEKELSVILEGMNNFEHKKYILRLTKEKTPETWINTFKSLALSVTNARLLDELVNHLKDFPDVLQDIYYTIFSVPKNYPHHFQWLLKKIQSGELSGYLKPAFIPRMLDSLNYVKGIRASVNKILTLKNFDEIIKGAKEEEARRVMEAVNSSTVLEDYQKQDYLRILEYHFPDLFGRESDVIYTTPEALKKRQQELEHLVNVEIPENKKEISRAREFGDLSENFEYKAAKEKQAQLYEKVRIIESELARATLIDPAKVDTTKAEVGTKLTLKNKETGEELQYSILGRWDTDLKKGIISNEAPLAKAMLGKKVGDRVMINNTEYELIKIEVH